MRYFLDTEYNGHGGQLISLALTPEHGDQEFYIVLPLPDEVEPWVERKVLPYLAMAPGGDEPVRHEEATSELAGYLDGDDDPVIVADWPEDIAHFCGLLTTGAGRMVEVANLGFELMRSPGFSAAANSAVPHNALHDARALRSYVLAQELSSLGAGGMRARAARVES